VVEGEGGKRDKSGVRLRLITRWVGLTLLVLVVAPPFFVAARQLIQIRTAHDENMAMMSAAHELYAATESRSRYHEVGQTISSMTYPDFLKCDVRREASEDKNVAESLDLAFFADASWRRQIEIERHLASRFSALRLALLTGCVEASVMASHCADDLFSLGAKAPKTTDPRISDAARAAAYCAGVKGLNTQGAPS
jgi:hypothetical protein